MMFNIVAMLSCTKETFNASTLYEGSNSFDIVC